MGEGCNQQPHRKQSIEWSVFWTEGCTYYRNSSLSTLWGPVVSTLLRKRTTSMCWRRCLFSTWGFYHLAWRWQPSHWNTNLSSRWGPEACTHFTRCSISLGQTSGWVSYISHSLRNQNLKFILRRLWLFINKRRGTGIYNLKDWVICIISNKLSYSHTLYFCHWYCVCIFCT